MRNKPWTEAERAIVRERFPHMKTKDLATELGRGYGSVNSMADRMGLKKSEEFFRNEALSGRLHGPRGAGSRFLPGHVTWNKGMKGLGCANHPNSVAARFKPGIVPHTWQPVGSYRIVPDGVLEQKVGEAKGPSHLRWKPVHRLVWEAANGPTPPGHIVVFKPGMKTNVLEEITLDRLECLTRRENMLRNSVHSKYPPELARLVQLRGALSRAIRQQEQAIDPEPQGKTA